MFNFEDIDPDDIEDFVPGADSELSGAIREVLDEMSTDPAFNIEVLMCDLERGVDYKNLSGYTDEDIKDFYENAWFAHCAVDYILRNLNAEHIKRFGYGAEYVKRSY